MKKYRFRFEILQKVRRIEKEAQIRVLALAGKAVTVAQQEKDKMVQSIDNEVARVRQVVAEGQFTPEVLELSGKYREELRRMAKRKETEIRDLKGKLETERKILIEREKKEKVLIKLREKEEAGYAEYIRQEQGKEMDEVALRSYIPGDN